MTKFSLSLSQLIANLLRQKREEEFSVLPDDEIKPTTVRLEPVVRKFCDIQSEKMGISVQSFISMVLHGVMLESISPVTSELTLMHERFFELFKFHKIPLAHIPLILKDFNITLSILSDRGRLLDAYSEKLLEYLSDLFLVHQGWLNGTNHYVTKGVNDWYKWCYSFCLDLLDLQKNNKRPILQIIKSDALSLNKIDDNINYEEDSVIVVVKGIHTYDDETKYFDFFRIFRGQPWSYWRCRTQLKAIVLFCYIMGIETEGYSVSAQLHAELRSNNALLPQNFSGIKSISWHPEDFIDAEEGTEPYPTSKTQDELEKVYKQFFSQRLDQLIHKKIDNLDGKYYAYNEGFFDKIKLKKPVTA